VLYWNIILIGEKMIGKIISPPKVAKDQNSGDYSPRIAKSQEYDNYLSRLVKLIPTEFIGAYLLIRNFIMGESGFKVLWFAIILAILVVLLILYSILKLKIKSFLQIFITVIAFFVWVYALDEPFSSFGIYNAALSSIIVILYSLLVATITPNRAR